MYASINHGNYFLHSVLFRCVRISEDSTNVRTRKRLHGILMTLIQLYKAEWTSYYELQTVWEDRHLTGVTEYNHDTPQSEYSVSSPSM
jgi:hypothetical protein